ncbi:MAG: hypothetical protein JSW61_01830 [Candidatus Thorarchaeota archaeon]|nr:MAG: hypothetical protein JSW61_01830 [Candidatus Thorarchaeota archaeon]
MKSARHRFLVTSILIGLLLALSMSSPADEIRCSPELRPTGSNMPSAVVWSDDFNDGDMDGWETWEYFGGDVNFTVVDGIVYSGGDGINMASHDSNVAYGTWSFDILIGGYQLSGVNFINDATGMGYGLRFCIESHNGIGQSSIQLIKDYPEVLLAHRVMNPSGWNNITVTRDNTGYFCVYDDENLIIEAVENSITTSVDVLFVFEESADCGFDNVVVSDTVDMDKAPPRFLQEPTDQTIQFGETFYYKLNASDYTGIDTWAIVDWSSGVSDTSTFAISSNGLITNLVDLEIGVYDLEVTVTDTLDNSRSVTFSLSVEAAGPAFDSTMLVVAGGGIAVIVIVLVMFLKKRS